MYTIAAAAAASGFLLLLWLVSVGRWIGFGDVKLTFPLGLIVGAVNVFSMMVLSFWIGAGISLLLISAAKLQRGQLGLRFLPANLTIKSVVPFAPFLVAGCLVVLFTKLNVLNLFTF
jgi:leader peptidase (prepilin peptidase)/N-methyltransferase